MRLPSRHYLDRLQLRDAEAILSHHERALEPMLDDELPDCAYDHRGRTYWRKQARAKMKRIGEIRQAIGLADV